jgi:hypothetical protein
VSGAARIATATLWLAGSWPAALEAQDRRGTPTGLYLIPTLELNFRGERGQTTAGGAFEFGNGPAFGLRAHAWLTDLFGVSAHGSYARTGHCEPDIDFCTQNEVTLWHGLGELTVRVKPGVPGYFLIGGGVTVVSPDADAAPAFRTSSHVEPTLTAGAGLDLGLSRRAIVRLDLRLYFVIPKEQAGVEVSSTQTDFALGVGVGYRL